MTTIIAGTDLSDNALKAVDWAFGLASLLDSNEKPARVRVVHVIARDELELRAVIGNNSEQRELRDLDMQLQKWLDDVDTRGIDHDTDVGVGRSAHHLSQVVADGDADWLVVGKSGRGRLSRLFVGSTSEHLAFRPPCPLAVIHPEADGWPSQLEVTSAVDLTPSAIHGAALGAELVRRRGGRLRILHVVNVPDGLAPGLEDTLESHLAETSRQTRTEIEALLADESVSLDDINTEIDIRPGYPVHEVLEVVENTDVDLLTLGCHGRSRLTDMMLGSIGRSLLKKAPCNVVVTPSTK